MEEKKDNKATTIGLNGKTKKDEKLSYEELVNICKQLQQQNDYLVKQLYAANRANMMKRLEFLFKAVELAPVIKDGEFINSCIAEIKEALTIPEDNKQTTEEKEA